jgi:hypothetical protein
LTGLVGEAYVLVHQARLADSAVAENDDLQAVRQTVSSGGHARRAFKRAFFLEAMAGSGDVSRRGRWAGGARGEGGGVWVWRTTRKRDRVEQRGERLTEGESEREIAGWWWLEACRVAGVCAAWMAWMAWMA